ncbi:MAG: hypothetical protein ACLGIR_11540 [Actinomycetes bacterium]
MATSERDRDELRQALVRALGDRPAETLMESLPPDRWDELARRRDLDPFVTKEDLRELEARMASKEDLRELEARMASKEDLRELEARMASKEDLWELRAEVRAIPGEIRADVRDLVLAQNRLLFFSMIGAIFTTASLAFAAAQL